MEIIELNNSNCKEYTDSELNAKLDSLMNTEKMDYKKIDNVEVDGIDTKDAPDFCDAYIESADYNGAPMTQDQLQEINEDYDYVYEMIMDNLY